MVGWKRKSVEPPQDRIDVCALKQKMTCTTLGNLQLTDVQHSSVATKNPRVPLASQSGTLEGCASTMGFSSELGVPLHHVYQALNTHRQRFSTWALIIFLGI